MNGQNVTTTPRWIGINGISQKLSDTSSALSTIASNAANASSSSDSWTTVDPPAFEKNLSNYYSTYMSQTLSNPNPAASQNGGLSSITPLYIANYGNYTVSGSILNTIYQEYTTKIVASIDFLDQAKSAASNISTYENQIQAELSSAENSVQSFNSTFTDVNSAFTGIVNIVY